MHASRAVALHSVIKRKKSRISGRGPALGAKTQEITHLGAVALHSGAKTQKILDDKVLVPTRLEGVRLGARQTALIGGTPPSRTYRMVDGERRLVMPRYAVHAMLTMEAFQELGYVVEESKTECGDTIVNLGARVPLREALIDCPGHKQITHLGP